MSNDESLQKIALRACVFLLNKIKHQDPEIEKTLRLYERAIAGDMPSSAEWQENIDALALDRARARALARALALDLDLAGDMVDYLLPLLGDRVPFIADMDARILIDIDGDFTLDQDEWNPCGTTYCMGGFSVLYAGDRGIDLVKHFSYSLASALIFKKSTGRIPNFYASNDEALEDMRLHS